jgi:hypothetical protein
MDDYVDLTDTPSDDISPVTDVLQICARDKNCELDPANGSDENIRFVAMEPEDVVVGIDMATTRCLVCVQKGSNFEILRNSQGDEYTQSSLLFIPETLPIIGKDAINTFLEGGTYPAQDLIENPKKAQGKRYATIEYVSDCCYLIWGSTRPINSVHIQRNIQ